MCMMRELSVSLYPHFANQNYMGEVIGNNNTEKLSAWQHDGEKLEGKLQLKEKKKVLVY